LWSIDRDLPIGSFGVNVFFVISGFLITTILLKEKVKTGSISLKNFYLRRILRIMPVAYLYIGVLILLNIIFNLHLSPQHFITAVLYIKNIPFKGVGDWYTGHFWSLSVEEQFYLIFPILLVFHQNKYVLIVTITVLLIECAEYLGYNSIWINQSNFIVHYLLFGIINLFGNGTIEILFGSLISVLLFKDIINFKGFKFNYWLSFGLFILTFLIDVFFSSYSIFSIFFSVILSFIILNNLYQSNFLGSVLNNVILVRIGMLSYSIYIWQQLFTAYQPWAKSFKYSNSIIFNLIALTIVVFSSYYLYELQFLKLKKKIKNN